VRVAKVDTARPTVAVTFRELAPFDKRLGVTQAQYETAFAEPRLAQPSVVPCGLVARPACAHVDVAVHGEILRGRGPGHRTAGERDQAADHSLGVRHAQRRLGVSSTKRAKSCTGSAFEIRNPCAWSQPMLDR